jgi:hypothetical protein
MAFRQRGTNVILKGEELNIVYRYRPKYRPLEFSVRLLKNGFPKKFFLEISHI